MISTQSKLDPRLEFLFQQVNDETRQKIARTMGKFSSYWQGAIINTMYKACQTYNLIPDRLIVEFCDTWATPMWDDWDVTAFLPEVAKGMDKSLQQELALRISETVKRCLNQTAPLFPKSKLKKYSDEFNSSQTTILSTKRSQINPTFTLPPKKDAKREDPSNEQNSFDSITSKEMPSQDIDPDQLFNILATSYQWKDDQSYVLSKYTITRLVQRCKLNGIALSQIPDVIEKVARVIQKDGKRSGFTETDLDGYLIAAQTL